MMLRTEYGCAECGRTFDLTDEEQAAEWHHGHDCDQARAADHGTVLEFHWQGAERMQVSAGATLSWHYIIDAPACTVEARCLTLNGRPAALADAYWVVASVPATIVDGWLPGWDSNGERQRKVGTTMHYHVQVYGYLVRASLAEGAPHWSLRTLEVQP